MLGDRFFAALGSPGEDRLRHLPCWAIRYERELRSLCSWWNDARRGKPDRPCPVPREPSAERVFRLPIWAFEWIMDLRFEVYWQRIHAMPVEVDSDEVDDVEEFYPLPLPSTLGDRRSAVLVR